MEQKNRADNHGFRKGDRGRFTMYERMLDKQNKPAFDDMAAYCGKGMELFIRINEWLSDTCGTVQELSLIHI